MTAFITVVVGIVIPFVLMFWGVILMIKSRNADNVRGSVFGVIFTLIGGLVLLGFSIFLVHELYLYAPYFS